MLVKSKCEGVLRRVQKADGHRNQVRAFPLNAAYYWVEDRRALGAVIWRPFGNFNAASRRNLDLSRCRRSRLVFSKKCGLLSDDCSDYSLSNALPNVVVANESAYVMSSCSSFCSNIAVSGGGGADVH